MDIPSGQVLIDALDQLWDKYRKRLNTCRIDSNEAAVHDLRTSTRRLMSLIELLRELTGQRQFNKFRRLLKAQLDGFDDLRDTQVMLLEVGNTIGQLPELAPFQQHMKQREQHLLFQTQAVIKSLYTGKLKRKFKKIQGRCKRFAAKKDIQAEVITVIDDVYAAVQNRHKIMDPTQLDSIHHLRIAVKKLRYTLAAALPMLPGLPEQQLKSMQNYLTLLGDIQNSAVLCQALEAFFAGGLPVAIQEHVRQRQLVLLENFIKRKDEVLNFWHIGKDKELPWEIGSGEWNLG